MIHFLGVTGVKEFRQILHSAPNPSFSARWQATECLAELVGARCRAMVALYAFEPGDDVGHLHALYQSAKALQISIASAIELHVGDDAVLHFHIDVAGAYSLGLVGCFHWLV